MWISPCEVTGPTQGHSADDRRCGLSGKGRAVAVTVGIAPACKSSMMQVVALDR
jgi:hypothetical protein